MSGRYNKKSQKVLTTVRVDLVCKLLAGMHLIK